MSIDILKLIDKEIADYEHIESSALALQSLREAVVMAMDVDYLGDLYRTGLLHRQDRPGAAGARTQEHRVEGMGVLMNKFNGVKVFAATMVADRQVLGEKVTEWMAQHPGYEVADIVVSQSSDSAFHCISIVLFYFDEKVQARAYPGATKLIR